MGPVTGPTVSLISFNPLRNAGFAAVLLCAPRAGAREGRSDTFLKGEHLLGFVFGVASPLRIHAGLSTDRFVH